MKKCYNIKTWEEQKDAIISLDSQILFILDDNKSCEEARRELGWSYGVTRCSENKKVQGWYDELPQSTPTDPVLAKLCKLTGAKIYDDYIVLSCFTGLGETLADQIVYTQGDVYKILMQQDKPIEQRNHVDYIDGKKTDRPLTLMIGFYNGNHDLIGDGVGYYRDIRSGDISILEYLNNAFEEYSKHLRNEENKFEEIKKLLNL